MSAEWNDHQESVPPLDKQERRMIDDISNKVRGAYVKLNAFLQKIKDGETKDKVTKSTVHCRVTIEGSAVKKMAMIKFLLVDGIGAETNSTLMQRIVEAGIHSFYDALMHSKLSALMQMQQIASMPPALRDSAMTVTMRQQLRDLLEHQAENNGLSDLVHIDNPQHDAPGPQAGYQQTGDTKPPTSTSVDPTCSGCGKIIEDEVYHHDSKTWHCNCLIDHTRGN